MMKLGFSREHVNLSRSLDAASAVDAPRRFILTNLFAFVLDGHNAHISRRADRNPQGQCVAKTKRPLLR